MPLINDSEIKHIDNIFYKNGWINKIYRKNEYIYIKNNEYDEFRIEVEDNLINIVSPIPNSSFLFKNTFKCYTNLCNYIEQHIANYDQKMII
jgi:hypothetical protein